MSLTSSVKDYARNLGFQLVGVTTPDPPPHFDFFQGWLAAGYHGEMAYLARDAARQRRGDPRRILPECRSILVLGMMYAAPTSDPSSMKGDGRSTPPLRAGEAGHRPHSRRPHSRMAGGQGGVVKGRIASYAWGQDYHDVLAERLPALVAFIEQLVGLAVPNRWYTDTGPILERDLAQRAGLGWIGKNTCLIHPKMGSTFFLAEVLLGIELEPDPPFLLDYCGSCTRCIDACPTDCILPDRTLDASRCISYLTIELKSPIPGELRPLMGNWVYGCDVCQQICPWNQRFAPPEGDPAFATHSELAEPGLVDEMVMDSQEFNRKFKGRPLRRAKRRGYLRNTAVALGNSGNESAIPVLVETLYNEPEPQVRGHAAWALGRIGSGASLQALQTALLSDPDQTVREEIRAALEVCAPDRGV